MKVYRDGNKLVHYTGESPRQFKGILFVVYEGESPETVKESVRAVNQLQGLEEVDAAGLPQSWRKALRIPELPETDSNPVNRRSAHPSPRRGGRNASSGKPKPRGSPDEPEIRYVKINPGIPRVCIPYFLGSILLSFLLFDGINIYFLIVAFTGAIWSVIYQCALPYLE